MPEDIDAEGIASLGITSLAFQIVLLKAAEWRNQGSI